MLALSQLTIRLNNHSNDKTRQSLILKISIIALIVAVQLFCTLLSKTGETLFTIGLILNSVLLLSLIILLIVHYYTDRDTEPSLPMIAVLCTVLMIHIALGFPWDFGETGNWIWGVSWFAVCMNLIAMPVVKRKKRRNDDDRYTIPIVESIGIGIVFVVLIVVALPTYEKAPVFWINHKNKDTVSYRMFSDSTSYNATFSNYANLQANGDYYSWITKMYPELSRLWMINRGRKWEQDMINKKEEILNSLLARTCFISGLPKKSHDDIIRNRDLRNTLQNGTQITTGDTTKMILNIVQKYCSKALKTAPEDTAIARQWKLYCECEDYCDMIKKQLQPLLDRVSTEHTNNVLARLWKLKAGKDSLDTLLHFRDRVNNQYYTENDFTLLSFYRDAAEFNYKEHEKKTVSQIEPLLRQIQWRGIFIFGSCLVLFILFRTEMRKSTPEDKKQDKEPSEQENIIASLSVSAEAKKEAIEKLRIQEALGAKNTAKKRVGDRIGSIDASILILVLLAVPLLISINEESVNTKEPYWFITLPNWYLPGTVANILNSSTTFRQSDTYVQKQDLEPVMQQLQDLQVTLDVNTDSVERLRGLVVENLDTAKNIQKLGIENLDTAKSVSQGIRSVRQTTAAILNLSDSTLMSKNDALLLYNEIARLAVWGSELKSNVKKDTIVSSYFDSLLKNIVKNKNSIKDTVKWDSIDTIGTKK